MCGVCGLAALTPAAEVRLDEGAIQPMIEALTHRGPDDLGTDRGPSAILGATRLAIRGLAGGKQPFKDEETGVVAVCNGEIDNSRELKEWLARRGRPVSDATDVVVILGLYLELGERCVDELCGAFALAIWDPRSRSLLLARDRAGERPLFYHIEDGLVRFATEIAALAQDQAPGLTPDLPAIARFLRFGSFVSPQTPFREIRKVAPAEVVVVDPSGVRHRKYWRWQITAQPKKRGVIEDFDRVFREAVRRQSDIEVEYGVFLSGGIDSSLVAAVARSVRPEARLRAYTLRFSEGSYDEGDYASLVARKLGCEQVPVWVSAEDLPAGIAELVRMVGEPLADPAWVPTALLARRAAEDVKLALVGEGADELFAGYPTYIGARAAQVYAGLPGWIKRPVRRAVDLWPPSDKKVTLSFLLKRFTAAAEYDGITRHLLWTSNIQPELLRGSGVVFDEEAARGDLPGGAADGGAPGKAAASAGAGEAESGEILDLVQRIDLETSLAEGLLTKADRASMRSAVELRAPFLDRAVMEFAATLPVADRVRGVQTKVFLKRYAERYLPREIIHRRKRGLSVPLSRWLREPLRDWAESRLGDPLLSRAGIDPAWALEIFRRHCAREADYARALWSVIVLDEWLRWAYPLTGANPPPSISQARIL
jgi:asparagine synthase (glutamine-hydrolysing)